MSIEKNLTIPILRKKLSELKAAPYNPKFQNEVEKAGLTKSLEKFGYVEPIVWNQRTGNIIDGHQRYFILLERGVEDVDVVVVDVSPEEEKQLNITLGNKHIAGSYNNDSLQSLLKEIQEDDNEIFKLLNMNDLKMPDWEDVIEIEKTPQLTISSANISISLPEKAKYLKDEITAALPDFISSHWSGHGIKVK